MPEAAMRSYMRGWFVQLCVCCTGWPLAALITKNPLKKGLSCYYLRLTSLSAVPVLYNHMPTGPQQGYQRLHSRRQLCAGC